VDYYDPYVPQLTKTRDYDFKMSSIDLSAEKLANYDLVILTTDHDEFDYDFIKKEAKLIIDTRGRFNNSEKVVRA
jgi:UDP-N-acetyl-D-glucosamine dehydrogenase